MRLRFNVYRLALLTTALLALGITGCGSSGADHIHRTRSEPLESVFEAGPQLLADPAVTLDTLRRLGVDRVKLFLPWANIAPDSASRRRPSGFDGANPAAYPATNWAIYDTIVRDAVARRIGLDLTLGEPPPLWAEGSGAPPGAHAQWKPSASEFGAFVRAVGTRYGGHYKPAGAPGPLPRVSFWSIWNEPNYGPDLAPQATDHTLVEVSPGLYRGLLNAAWGALGATGHGHDTVLIGELAPRGQTGANHPGNFDGMVPLRFIRALYCVDAAFKPLRGPAATARGCPSTAAASRAFRSANPALFHASGFADHPYPQGQTPPTFVTPDEPDYADFAALAKLITTLDRAHQAYGSPTRFPVWSTEFGYKTDPPLALQATPGAAAGLINWSEYLTWRNPRLRSFDQYQLVDPPGNGPSNFVTGLEFANGTPKVSYDAFRMPLWLPRRAFSLGQALELWGCVRPWRFARLDSGHVKPVKIEFERGGHGPFKIVTTIAITGPGCYFDVQQKFPAGGAVRLAWSYPHGPEIFSRTVTVTTH